MKQKPLQSHDWNVEALIQAALAQPQQDRLSKHISLPAAAEQLIPTAVGSAFVSAPAGTTFDPEDVDVEAQGNMGDVIGVDLKELAARQLLIAEQELAAS